LISLDEVDRRKISAEEQVKWILDVTKELKIKDTTVVNAAISSVKDWVSNKACRLRKHFVQQGINCYLFAYS
jgi:hypothetical protein